MHQGQRFQGFFEHCCRYPPPSRAFHGPVIARARRLDARVRMQIASDPLRTRNRASAAHTRADDPPA